MDRVFGGNLQDIDVTVHDGTGEDEFKPVELVTLVSGKLATAIAALPPHLTQANEMELHQLAKPSPVEWKLRQQLTDLVAEAKANLRDQIKIGAIYEGICARQTFFSQVLPNPLKVAFITRPIVEHTAFYNAIHQEALSKLFQIVQRYDVDPKFMPALLKLAETAGNRVHGAVAQKMQISSKNLNVEMNSRDLSAAPESPDDIQDQISQLQAKLLEGPKDVTPKKD